MWAGYLQVRSLSTRWQCEPRLLRRGSLSAGKRPQSSLRRLWTTHSLTSTIDWLLLLLFLLSDWLPVKGEGLAHPGARPTGCGWLPCGAPPHMLASWTGGRCSSAGARGPGSEPSAYSPRPGWTRLSGGEKEREREKHTH